MMLRKRPYCRCRDRCRGNRRYSVALDAVRAADWHKHDDALAGAVDVVAVEDGDYWGCGEDDDADDAPSDRDRR